MALQALGYAGFGSAALDDWRQFGTVSVVGWCQQGRLVTQVVPANAGTHNHRRSRGREILEQRYLER